MLATTFEGDAAAMLTVLCEQHAGWSSTDPMFGYEPVNTYAFNDAHEYVMTTLPPGTLSEGQDDGRYVGVKGVGIAYNSEPMTFMGEVGYRQVDPDDWRTIADVDTDCEWAYAIHAASHTLTIFELRCADYAADYSVRNYSWVPVAIVSLDTVTDEDLARMELECSERGEAQWEAQKGVSA